jgi:hypothetical protein
MNQRVEGPGFSGGLLVSGLLAAAREDACGDLGSEAAGVPEHRYQAIEGRGFEDCLARRDWALVYHLEGPHTHLHDLASGRRADNLQLNYDWLRRQQS